MTWSNWRPRNDIYNEEDAEEYYSLHASHGATGDWSYFECDRCGIRFMVEFFDEPVGEKQKNMAKNLWEGR